MSLSETTSRAKTSHAKIRMEALAIAVLATCIPHAEGLPRASRSGMATVPQAAQTTPPRRLGTIKAIDGNTITLAPDVGPEIQVTVQNGARLRSIAPGEKDPKKAAPIQLQDLQVGDRILIAGEVSDDGKSVSAFDVLAMKRSDLEARHAQEQQDWLKRGIGGMVSSVDPVAGTVTISVSNLRGSKAVVVHTSASTVIRRYAPDSVKFDDAKPSTLGEIHANDQLRARGDRSPDGADFTAEEIVAGSFRNIQGLITSVDASSNTMSVQDLASKKTVQIKITADSQMHRLPPEMANRLAMRFKGGTVGGAGPNASPGGHATGNPQANGDASHSSVPASVPGGGPNGTPAGGAPDLNQVLARTPTVTLADLHKGDAVILVATEGSPSRSPTAVIVVSGVEPILQAAPSASQALMLAPWSLGGAPPGDVGSQ
jgi:Domain of unknown function (DUF5666)